MPDRTTKNCAENQIKFELFFLFFVLEKQIQSCEGK